MKSFTTLAMTLIGVVLLTPNSAAAAKLDEGRLDPQWFGDSVSFRATEEIDYLWVADGLNLQGATIRMADWEDPEFLGEKRKSKDQAKAAELTDRWPSWLRGAVGSVDGITATKEGGDFILTGRIVDCDAGSKAAKWLVGLGAGSATATWDMKLVKAKGGQLVMALHHRAVSGTTMSEIEDKIAKWLEEGLVDALQRGPAKVYAGGKTPKD